MKKENAKKILALPPKTLIELWKKTNNEAYQKLRETRTDEEIVRALKMMAKDLLEGRATVFEMKDGSKMIDYLGEAER